MTYLHIPPNLFSFTSNNIISLIFIRFQNGKQQTRRLGIAPNNRAIYITTHKHPQGRVLGLLQGVPGVADEAFAGAGPVKEVDLSRVVRMQLGQQSRRFVKAR